MSNTSNLISVEAYFVSQPRETREMLEEIRACIFKVHPNSEELLNYNIPAYTFIEGGKREQQILMSGYKKHVGFYPHPTTIAHFSSELESYKQGKGSVQFPLNKALPLDLIEKMIRYRMKLLKE